MEFWDDDINNICDWEFVCDRIDIGGGRGYLIGDRATPYGVATIIIFIYREGGDGIVVWWCLFDIFDYFMDNICDCELV